MDFLIDLLSNPKLWSILTPAGIVTMVLGFALYKLFDKYDKLQEQRLAEWKSMVEDYNKLTVDVNKTLDTLLRVIGSKNGNGGTK